MRINIVKQVFKKEIIDILRDKKTVFMMIILPLLIYPLIMIGASQIMMMSMNDMNSKEINIAFNKKPDSEFVDLLNNKTVSEGKEVNSTESEDAKVNIIEVEDYKKSISNGAIDAYIELKDDGDKIGYNVYIDSSSSNASIVSDRLEDTFDAYKSNLVDNNIKDNGLNPDKVLNPILYKEIDVASNEEIAGNLLGRVLPFILVVGILMGAIYPAIDVMAGEKERGTLETLFTLPISNFELVIGKYLSVTVVAIASALFNILSMGLTMFFIMNMAGDMGSLGFSIAKFSGLIFPLIITILCICVFAMVVSAVSMCICSMAKSFKEAQNYMTPLMLVIMLPSYVSMIPNMELNYKNVFIPVINISLLIKSVLSFNSSISLMGFVLLSNVIFVILALMLLAKLFNSEEILFGDRSGFSFLEKRKNIKKGTMPKPSDGFILYVVSLVLLIYLGGYLQLKYKMAGIIMTQGIFLTVVGLFTFYIKSNPVELFNLRMPRILDVLKSLILYALSYIVIMLIMNMLLKVFPDSSKIVEGLNDALYIKGNIVLNVILIAGTPAICEELLFRGFIFSSLKNIKTNNEDSKKPIVFAILVSSLMFGIMHMNFIRIIPTTILGMVFAYSMYKSKSIFVPMLLHFINNSISVIGIHFVKANPHLGFIYPLSNIDGLYFAKLALVFMVFVMAINTYKYFNKNNTLNLKSSC